MSSTLAKRRPSGSESAKRRIGRNRRHYRLRKKVFGTAERPRLAVFRSSKNISVQIIDDVKGHTLVSASSLDASVKSVEGNKSDVAKEVGKLIAERAKSAGVEKVVLDRGGVKYAGRVAALAEAAREGGLDF
ncbi:50S ribosomal protein L18 [Natronoglycomyces albus]|uniref:Large ribosomal subunit protein uL18 n=1 Tax=Natronoglycomyces albus TaxID=2811108 RepID=A0A895XNA1_9ACTN|nr:50S ribosomal protein L18 [Natronoglycomyces albus]QSB04525.1 50S ribosomal protein L18 [Natronoglycomyces albus]